MSFRITGLDPTPFRPLYGLPDEELARLGVKRCLSDAKPGFPDRVELCDAEPGEKVMLLNYIHQPADTPYRSSHAIFVREGAERAYEGRDERRSASGSGCSLCAPSMPRASWSTPISRMGATSRPPSSGSWPIRRRPIFTPTTPSAAATPLGSIGGEAIGDSGRAGVAVRRLAA